MTDTIHALAGDFPAKTDEDWRVLAEKALRGADFDETLNRSTEDGISRGPVFCDRPEGSGAVDGQERDLYLPWGMRQTLVEADPAAANDAALADLMGGVSELELRLDPTGRFGVKLDDLDDLDACLKGVDMSLAPVHLDAISQQSHLADSLLTLFARRRLDGEAVRGGLGLSPIESAACAATELDGQAVERLADIAQLAGAAFPHLKVVRCDAAFVHEAGGTEAQELAVMVAAGAAYMRVLMDAGIGCDEALGMIEIRLAADTDIHLSIAKLRAARRIWTRIAASYGAGVKAQRASIQARTSGRMLSAKDPWTNLIRNACAGFAAAAGGADAVTIRPLTDAIGRPTGFGRRVARNLHILLAEESHMGKVSDPASGSYLHAHLCEDLAQASWTIFQDIEARGGLHRVIADGWLGDQVATARDARFKAIADGKSVILGVTKFPDSAPKPVDTADTWPDAEEGPLCAVNLAARFEEAAQ